MHSIIPCLFIRHLSIYFLTRIFNFFSLVHNSRTQDTISVTVLQELKYGNQIKSKQKILIIIISCIDPYRVKRSTIEPSLLLLPLVF